MVGAEGFEPSTTCVQDRYANRTALHTVLNLLVAVRVGFEPTEQVWKLSDCLVGNCIKPLYHLTIYNNK